MANSNQFLTTITINPEVTVPAKAPTPVAHDPVTRTTVVVVPGDQNLAADMLNSTSIPQSSIATSLAVVSTSVLSSVVSIPPAPVTTSATTVAPPPPPPTTSLIPTTTISTTLTALVRPSSSVSFTSISTSSDSFSATSVPTNEEHPTIITPVKQIPKSLIGGIVAIILAVIVVVALAFYCIRKRQTRNDVKELPIAHSKFNHPNQSIYYDLDPSRGTVWQRLQYSCKSAFAAIRRGFVRKAGVVSAGAKSKIGTFKRKTTMIASRPRIFLNGPRASTPPAAVNMNRGTSQFLDAPALRSPLKVRQSQNPINPFRDPKPAPSLQRPAPIQEAEPVQQMQPFNPAANNSTGTLQPGLFRGLLLHLHVPASTVPSTAAASQSDLNLPREPAKPAIKHSRFRSAETVPPSAGTLPSLSEWWPATQQVLDAMSGSSTYSHSVNNSDYHAGSHGVGIARSADAPAPLNVRRDQSRQKHKPERDSQVSWYEREVQDRQRWTRLDMERARQNAEDLRR